MRPENPTHGTRYSNGKGEFIYVTCEGLSAAKARGQTWHEVGAELGVSFQSVQQRHSGGTDGWSRTKLPTIKRRTPSKKESVAVVNQALDATHGAPVIEALRTALAVLRAHDVLCAEINVPAGTARIASGRFSEVRL